MGLSLALFISMPLMAKQYVEGVSYTKLNTPVATKSGDKIEVVEFFWYGCPHCFRFEPTIKKWKKTLPKNVHFVRVPSPINPSWMPHTKTYYALEMMGEGEKYHDALFNAIHVKREKLYDQAALTKFLVKQGVDEKAFNNTIKSFAVEMRARQAMQMSKGFNLNGVPMLAVNGKYTVSASQAGGYQGMVDTADHLINKEANSKK